MPNPIIVTPLHNDEGLICRGVTFTGTNYLTRGGSLTGVANSKKGIFSGFFNRPVDGSPLGDRYVFNHGSTEDPADTGSLIRVHHNDQFEEETAIARLLVQLQSSTSDDILQMESAYYLSAAVSWHHYFAWWDLETPGSSGIRIDGGPTILSPYSEVNDTIAYDTPAFIVCAGATNYFAGDVAKLYYAPGQWLDGSDETVLRKFLGTNGKPRHIGIDGSMPTGTPPLVFLNIAEGGAAAEFAVNRGTGGDLTIVGGLALSATSPSD